MPAKSKAQQRFMGMVHAVKKGEMAAPSPEVAQAAASMKKKDAKDFASTKHKGLPEKKLEECITFSEFIVEAQKRIKVLRTAHYTTNSNKANIHKSGFKDSPSTGSYHPDDNKRTVYTTPSSRVGNEYGSARVNLKIVNPKIKTTDSPKNYGKKVRNWVKSSSEDDLVSGKNKPTSAVDQSRSAIKKGAKVVRVPDAHGDFEPNKPGKPKGSYIMVDKDVANKSIDKNPSPTIRTKGNKRTKTRPKSKK